jgi:hypothetical protein
MLRARYERPLTWEIPQLDASSTPVGSLRNSANSIIDLRVTKKDVRKETKNKRKEKKCIFEGCSQLRKLSVDNVWPSFNGLMGWATAHPTVCDLAFCSLGRRTDPQLNTNQHNTQARPETRSMIPRDGIVGVFSDPTLSRQTYEVTRTRNMWIRACHCGLDISHKASI